MHCVIWMSTMFHNFFSWNCHGLGFYYSRNRHSWRHIGHKCWVCWVCNHFIMQWMWKQWVQAPQTSGQSSPGLLQSGQQPSKATLQIPQVSSLAIHFQEATPFQPLTVTFNLVFDTNCEIWLCGEFAWGWFSCSLGWKFSRFSWLLAPTWAAKGLFSSSDILT